MSKEICIHIFLQHSSHSILHVSSHKQVPRKSLQGSNKCTLICRNSHNTHLIFPDIDCLAVTNWLSIITDMRFLAWMYVDLEELAGTRTICTSFFLLFILAVLQIGFQSLPICAFSHKCTLIWRNSQELAQSAPHSSCYSLFSSYKSAFDRYRYALSRINVRWFEGTRRNLHNLYLILPVIQQLQISFRSLPIRAF